jgi:hypothetical protein
MSDIDSVIRYSKKLEKRLEQQYGANGRGLHEKASSVESQLTASTLKSLRWVATMRNKVVHEDDFQLDNLSEFERTCERLLSELGETTPPANPLTAPKSTHAPTQPAPPQGQPPVTASPRVARTPMPQPRAQPTPRGESAQQAPLPDSLSATSPPSTTPAPAWPSVISVLLIVAVIIWALTGWH